KFLLQGPSHERAVRLLSEFVETRGETLVDDPLKRAVMQRDLWIVFDWLEGPHTNFLKPPLSDREVAEGVRHLRGPLATVIARLALTPDEIRKLPDNYAAAARAGAAPSGLFDSAGPWVSVGRADGPTARAHAGDEGPAKNSTFLVMLRLPDGRASTLAFLDRLRSFDGPAWVDTTDNDLRPFSPYYPNPNLPQFPIGTRVALVRRALVVDASGRVVASPLTESVQLRTYDRVDAMTAHAFRDAHNTDEGMFS